MLFFFMAVFTISYDLNKQGQNYEAIWAELKRTEYNHIMDSTWLISTSENVSQIQDRVKKHLDANDRLLISKLNRGEYNGWLTNDQWAWIRERL